MCKSINRGNNLNLIAFPDQRVVRSCAGLASVTREDCPVSIAVLVKEQGQCSDTVLTARLHVSSAEHTYVSVCI